MVPVDEQEFDRYPLGSREYWRVTVSLFLAGFVTFALLYATQPVLPLLSAAFEVSPATSALSVSVATIGLGLALVVAGPLSERRGRTPLMFVSLFAASAVGLACAAAPTWAMLLTLRAVQGVVLAGLPAVAMAYLSEELTANAQAGAAGIYIGGTALGGMSGRLLGGGLAEIGGWRLTLGGLGALGLICATAVFLIIPRSRHFVAAAPGWARLAGATRAILTDPAMLALFAIAACAMGTFVGVYNALGYRLESAPYNLSVGVAGLVYLAYALGSVSSAQAGRAAGRLGQRAVAPWCAALMLVGLGLTLAQPLWLVVAGLCVLTAAFFALHGVASGWVAARATLSPGSPGQASSAYLVCYYAGSSVFGALAAVAWARAGWPAVAGLGAALTLMALLATLYLRRVPSLHETQRPIPGSEAY